MQQVNLMNTLPILYTMWNARQWLRSLCRRFSIDLISDKKISDQIDFNKTELTKNEKMLHETPFDKHI